jgi:hypothetical protein
LETGDGLALAAAQILQGKGPGQLQKNLRHGNPKAELSPDSGDQKIRLREVETGERKSQHKDVFAPDDSTQPPPPTAKTSQLREEFESQTPHTKAIRALKYLFGHENRLKNVKFPHSNKHIHTNTIAGPKVNGEANTMTNPDQAVETTTSQG